MITIFWLAGICSPIRANYASLKLILLLLDETLATLMRASEPNRTKCMLIVLHHALFLFAVVQCKQSYFQRRVSTARCQGRGGNRYCARIHKNSFCHKSVNACFCSPTYVPVSDGKGLTICSLGKLVTVVNVSCINHLNERDKSCLQIIL